jgi:PAS domain-containing protein
MALDPGTRLLRFTALLEASPDSVAVVGLDGYLEFLNGTGRRLVGVADDADVTTLRYADLLTPTGLAAMAQLQRASENDLGR